MAKVKAGMSIDLAKLQSVIKKMKGKNGEVECLVIPLSQNFLEVTTDKNDNKHINLSLYSQFDPTELDDYGKNGWIVQSHNSKEYQDASKEEKRNEDRFPKLPFLGNIRILDGYNDETSIVENPANESGVYEEEDDLPF